ncbi:hypothetical protein AJ78_01248 [Emergomyces pasteurianus Ep9510]|uniref:Uncharacterized protein n=1 Tax=Emergomyces pasteurianus Ep9510 TaxID=1447872 RepID=A0A1J9PQR5_9EURO|nr:hypothetical protein AJ78_01248 [Emergomyces pasteurianus Ep9510]
MGRPVFLYSLGSSAIFCTATSAVINGVFAASLEHAIFDQALLAYMSVVLTSLSSIVLGLLLVSFTRNTARGRKFWKSWNGLAFALLGGALCTSIVFVAIALRWCANQLKGGNATLIGRHTRELYSAWCGVWAVASTFQIIFYVCLALPSDYKPNLGSDSISYIASRTSCFLRPNGQYTRTRDRRPSAAVLSIASSEHKRSPKSPTNSHRTAERKNPGSPLYSGNILQNSHILQHLQQHNSAHSHQQVQHSKPHKTGYPFDHNCNPLERENTFDQWDTSSVPREICDALLQSTLEKTSRTNRSKSFDNNTNYTSTPQPDSRASSFASTTTIVRSKSCHERQQSSGTTTRSPRKDSILPESPTLASLSFSLPSSPSICPCGCTSHFTSAPYQYQYPNPYQYQYPYDFYEPLVRPKFPTRQRAQSFEDHIHPLFRSSSPDPPPVTTRGTVVTASPVAGQTITKKTLSRIKSGSFSSQPASSSPLAQTETMDQTMDLSVGEDVIDESDDVGEGGQEDPSKDGTAPLPLPIPGFVLAAGTRGSWVDYGRRKTSQGRANDDGG